MIFRNFYKHLFYEHGEREPEERTGFFSICIVQRPSDKAFLMVQEHAGSGFWVPGGGLNPGESYTKGERYLKTSSSVSILLPV